MTATDVCLIPIDSIDAMMLEFHPIADLFPLMEGEAFQELVADIYLHKLREPIVLHQDGRILDGRNRYRACLQAGVEPRFEPYDGDDPLRFVISMNIHRRQLTTGQKAAIAVELATMRQGERTDLAQNCARLSQDEAAKAFGIGRRTLQMTKTVRDRAIPEVFAAVKNGRLTPSEAERLVDRPPDYQLAVATKGSSKAGYASYDYVDWHTPEPFLALVRVTFGGEIDLDPASSEVAQRRVRAKRFFTKEQDGLAQEWHGSVFLNPPYDREVGRFVDKMIEEHEAGRVTQSIMLMNARTDTLWFDRLAGHSTRICFTHGRIPFVLNDTSVKGTQTGQVIAYTGANYVRFTDVFRAIGNVYPQPVATATGTVGTLGTGKPTVGNA